MDFQFVEVEKIRVRYIDVNRKNKNAVLLLHGLGGSIESWTKNINGLAKELRVIALDLPGFGYSDKPKMNYTIEFYSGFVAKFVKKLDAAPLTIVGSSLGAHVAAEVAINHREVVLRLVLISPPGALPKSFKATPALKKYVKVLEAKSVEQVKRALFAVDGKPVDDLDAKLVYDKLVIPGAKQAFLSALKGSAQARRLNNWLSEIKAPAMVIWGKDDTMIPVKFVEPFVKARNFRVVLLERCGHRPHADVPQVFNALVAGFASEG